jgi:hypothetical protein
MSRRNGDKARFGRQRQRKTLQRKNSREVRKALEALAPSVVSLEPADGQLVGVVGPADQVAQ